MADPSTLSDQEILAKVVAQPESEQIAESLGINVEDYAKRVLFYLRHPNQQPVVEIMSDDEAREAGMPLAAECVLLLDRAIEEAEREEQAHYAGFDDDEKSAATTTGGSAKKRAPRIGEARGAVLGEESLRQEVTDVRRRHRTSGGLAEAARHRESKEGKGAVPKVAAKKSPA